MLDAWDRNNTITIKFAPCGRGRCDGSQPLLDDDIGLRTWDVWMDKTT